MARQQLINLHSSEVKHPSDSTVSPAIAVGEIVIQAVKSAATIYTKVSSTEYAEFIDKAQIEALITGSSASLIERIGQVESGLSQVSGVVTTIEPMAKSALQSVSASGANSYVSAAAAAKSGEDGAKTQDITVTANVAGTLDSVTETGSLADAKHVKDYVDGAISTEASARTQKDTLLENALTAVTEKVDYGFSGLTIDANNSVKTYVDNAVSTAVGSVYRVKGTVANEGSLPTEKEAGDVYNITAASSYGPAGTNVVYDGSQWDALGGTYDLTPYAFASALTNEITARGQADDAINAKIGGNFSESSTVASAITAAKTSADNKLATVSATGANVYVAAAAGSVTGEAGSKTQEITVTANVAPQFSAVSATGSLADAKQVKDYVDAAINTITGNTDSLGDRVEVLEGKVNTISGDVSTLKTKVSALDSNAVTAATLAGDTYVTGSTSIANNNLAITLTPDVAGAISSVTEQGSLADAKLVKDYVDAEVAEASSSLTQRVGKIEGVLGSNTAYTSSHTVTDALAALESGAVKTITVKNTNTNKITTSKTDNNVEFDFDNMVIDCGTY